MAAQTVLVIGDLICDHYVWGDVSRISPEAPVQVLEWEREVNRAGGAANVALNLASLGYDVKLAGVVGQDVDGKWLREELSRHKIDTNAIVVSKTRPTTRKLRIIARGQQLLRVDREDRNPIGRQDERLLLQRIRRARHHTCGIICSDYAKGVLTESILDLVLRNRLAKNEGLVLVDPKDRNFARYRGADILTPNEREIIEATGGTVTNRPSHDLSSRAKTVQKLTNAKAVLITRGQNGMDLFDYTNRTVTHSHVPAFQTHEVFDVTGAGDTVTAVMGIEAFKGTALAEAARRANIAAGLVVGVVGTSTIDRDALERVMHGALAPSGSKILSRSTLLSQLVKARQSGSRVVFTNGCFDVLHTGHLHLLQRARALGDLLIVGINSDQSVKRLKGNDRPLIGENERAELLAALSCVDYVTVFSERTPLRVITAVNPDVLVKGADYSVSDVVGRNVVEQRGGRVELVPLLPGFSTTGLVESIKQKRTTRE
jgi:D-beta-D-heptose 7-phosphate kinase/D-beta-D-heptose 1-phosphate adenosyltransferase|tara:strand:- start:13427 stop:14887 length:1461 start_codon:yes stop_codon:yes gene_type:complete